MVDVQDRVAAALLRNGAPWRRRWSRATTLSRTTSWPPGSPPAGRAGAAGRSLVVLRRDLVEFVTTYLALLEGAHVPLLAGEHADRLAEAWAADAVVDVDGTELRVERATTAGRTLHPDLACCSARPGRRARRSSSASRTTTSSATPAPSPSYLGLTPADRGITSLPLHYCYGLSVLHSHLLAGASVVTIKASVVDPCFAAAMRRHGVTNVAGVPHTFELLERAGPDLIHVPSLRFVTQAGGRLPPRPRREWLDAAEQWGIDFYVMYGQTEATARIAYLPPRLASRHPQAIGVPIPGGAPRGPPGRRPARRRRRARVPRTKRHARLRDDAGRPRRGATLDELATGDLARFDAADGVFELVGRRSRFVKPFGLRIDLDAVEADLAAGGIDAVVAGDDERIVVCAPDAPPDTVRRRIAALTGLPLAPSMSTRRASRGRRPARSTTRRCCTARGRAPTSVGRPRARRAGVGGGRVLQRPRPVGHLAAEHVRVARWRLAELRRVLGATRAVARPPPARLAPAALSPTSTRRSGGGAARGSTRRPCCAPPASSPSSPRTCRCGTSPAART